MAANSESPAEAAAHGAAQADIDALLKEAEQGASAEAPQADSAALTPEDIDALVNAAASASPVPAAVADPPPSSGRGSTAPNIERFDYPSLAASPGAQVDPKRLSMLSDVKLRVKVELGRTRMLVEDVLSLGEGSVVELDKLAGDPVDVYANDRLVARGEVLVLNDSFCVRISEVISSDPHRVST